MLHVKKKKNMLQAKRERSVEVESVDNFLLGNSFSL